MLDWSGRVASMLFVAGCNFRCAYCHNPDLVGNADHLPDLSWRKIARYLEARRGWLDGCIVSGGEPTRYPGLAGLLGRIKELGYPVKVDTNGSSPGTLTSLIDAGLVDCVAMDVKASPARYPEAVRAPVPEGNIARSIELLAEAHSRDGLEVEFRTTVVPGIVSPEDVVGIASVLAEAGAPRYVLQQFKPDVVLDEEARAIVPYTRSELQEMAAAAGALIPTGVRGA